MYNRYQGNTGRVVRVDEAAHREAARILPRQTPPPQRNMQPRRNHGPQPGLMEQIGRLLPGSAEDLETEDIILIMILYLMYRESGDSELLIIMGAMFLL